MDKFGQGVEFQFHAQQGPRFQQLQQANGSRFEEEISDHYQVASLVM